MYIMRIAGLDEAQAGIKIAGRNTNNLRYADDTTLTAEREELKILLMKVKEESKKVDFKIFDLAAHEHLACSSVPQSHKMAASSICTKQWKTVSSVKEECPSLQFDYAPPSTMTESNQLSFRHCLSTSIILYLIRSNAPFENKFFTIPSSLAW